MTCRKLVGALLFPFCKAVAEWSVLSAVVFGGGGSVSTAAPFL
jgi:hypothetical protein